MKFFRYLRAAGSFENYYRLINDLYHSVFGREMMMHYPLYKDKDESIEQRLINLVDQCLSELRDLSGKRLLEVGCGNGANCKYIAQIWDSTEIIGIDLNEQNLVIADESRVSNNIQFIQDDAQKLDHIEDGSVDILICIESAFHYPDKHAFFKQIKRVLAPGGRFLVADILLRTGNKGRSLWWWKKSMKLNHASEEDYHGFANSNDLRYQKYEDITTEIVRGYEGHRSWIPRENRSWGNFLLLRFTLAVLVRVWVSQLKQHKRYMIFSGVHA
jgi:ubiquinone/menaquinone biosynthesis C-methylase UbiE